jgi:hypothetical protein
VNETTEVPLVTPESPPFAQRRVGVDRGLMVIGLAARHDNVVADVPATHAGARTHDGVKSGDLVAPVMSGGETTQAAVGVEEADVSTGSNMDKTDV